MPVFLGGFLLVNQECNQIIGINAIRIVVTHVIKSTKSEFFIIQK